MEEVLLYISLIISVSAVLAIIARMIKQPAIIAYLIAGILVGPICFNFVGPGTSSEMMQTFARIGVAFLLFIVGLSLDFRLLKEIGKVSAISGIIQILSVGLIGFFVSIWIGFSNIAALYIGVAIAFSSTVVVVKILSDKKELNTLHGRISLGILIIQDIVASIFLMAIPLFDKGGSLIIISEILVMGLLLIVGIFIFSWLILWRFLNYLAKSQEALFLFGIAWALIISTLFYKLGFSIEIGALVAGMSLASSKYALDLEGKMKPLRDFFVVLFFVFFGSQLTLPITFTLIKNAIIFSVLVMIIKPIIVMLTMKFFGYTKRTNFLTSITLTQVSEFSLIIVLLGFSLGHLNQEIMNLTIFVALITIGLSAYTINFSSHLSDKLLRFLNIFDGNAFVEKTQKGKDYDVILFGYHRIGYKLFNTLKKMNKNLLVVDYNPKVVTSLIGKNIDCIYGDAGNKNFLAEIGMGKVKLVISTIPDEQINLIIADFLKEISSKAVFITTAEQPRIALDLYNAGADYVIVPQHLGGEYAAQMIDKFKTDKEKYSQLGKQHKKSLQTGKARSNYKD